MRAAILVAFALLAAPAAAPAATVERLVDVGPVLDGDSVTWGEGGWGADLSLHTLRPDGSVVERWRMAADTRPKHTLQWGGFAGPLGASPTWLAFYTVDEEILEASGDSITGTNHDTLWIGRDGAAPQPRTGPSFTGVAVDGTRLATLEYEYSPPLRADVHRVRVREGDSERVFRIVRRVDTVRRIRLAGRYLAWGSDDRVVVLDLVTNRRVLVLRRRALGWRGFGGFDLQPDGRLFLVVSRRRGRYSSQGFVVTATPRRPRLRVLADDAFGSVEAGGDRAVYVREKDSRTNGLAVVSIDRPREPRVVARWTRRQQLADSFDFDGRRLAYAIADVPEPDDVPPDARGRVVVEEL